MKQAWTSSYTSFGDNFKHQLSRMPNYTSLLLVIALRNSLHVALVRVPGGLSFTLEHFSTSEVNLWYDSVTLTHPDLCPSLWVRNVSKAYSDPEIFNQTDLTSALEGSHLHVKQWTFSYELSCAASWNPKNISIVPNRVGESDNFCNCFSGKLFSTYRFTCLRHPMCICYPFHTIAENKPVISRWIIVLCNRLFTNRIFFLHLCIRIQNQWPNVCL